MVRERKEVVEATKENRLLSPLVCRGCSDLGESDVAGLRCTLARRWVDIGI